MKNFIFHSRKHSTYSMFTDLPSVSHVLTNPNIQASLMLKLRNVYHSGLLSDITPTDAKKGQ